MKAEDIMGMAESAALFMRSLVEGGVPAQSAVSLTCSFITAMVLKSAQKPSEPWESK